MRKHTGKTTSKNIQTMYEQTGRVMDATNFYIALYDEALDEVSFVLNIEEGRRMPGGKRRSGWGMTEHIIQSKRPLLFKEDVAEEQRRRERRPQRFYAEDGGVWIDHLVQHPQQPAGVR